VEKPIRILHVFGSLNRGGAETMAMNLYRKIDKTKIQFDFVVHGDLVGDYEEEIEGYGGKIYRIPRYKGSNHFLYAREWKRFLTKHQEYKIVHSHVRSTASIYLAIAKEMGRVTIIHSHNTSSGKGISAIAKNILQSRLRRVSDYYFACSTEAGEWLFGKEICQSDKFFLTKNAIDIEKFSFCEAKRAAVRRRLGLENKIVIGHIGRFNPQKNHEFIIDIFQKTLEILPKSCLLLVGEGNLEPIIQDKVNNLGLSDEVLFAGVRTDITDLLQAMDFFLMPSLFEGLPVVLIETQAAGLPALISTEISNEVKITDFIESLSLDENSSVWAAEIKKMLQKITRKNMHAGLLKAGYDIKAAAAWYESFYLEVTHENNEEYGAAK